MLVGKSQAISNLVSSRYANNLKSKMAKILKEIFFHSEKFVAREVLVHFLECGRMGRWALGPGVWGLGWGEGRGLAELGWLI